MAKKTDSKKVDPSTQYPGCDEISSKKQKVSSKDIKTEIKQLNNNPQNDGKLI